MSSLQLFVRGLAIVAILGTLGASADAQTADFEDLVVGTTYNTMDMFTSNGINFTVGDFTFGGGGMPRAKAE